MIIQETGGDGRGGPRGDYTSSKEAGKRGGGRTVAFMDGDLLGSKQILEPLSLPPGSLLKITKQALTI